MRTLVIRLALEEDIRALEAQTSKLEREFSQAGSADGSLVALQAVHIRKLAKPLSDAATKFHVVHVAIAWNEARIAALIDMTHKD